MANAEVKSSKIKIKLTPEEAFVQSPTPCSKLPCSTFSQLSVVYVCSFSLARVRSALGSRARQDSPGAQQRARGLLATDVHQQRGASARDRGMLVKPVVTLPALIKNQRFLYTSQRRNTSMKHLEQSGSS